MKRPSSADRHADRRICLPGCGRQDAGGNAEVVYNCPANAADIDALKREIPAFTAESHVNIKLNPFTGQDKLYAMMAAGQAPDIFYTNTTMRDRLAAEGRLLDLRTVSDGDPFVERLWPAVITNGTSRRQRLVQPGELEFHARGLLQPRPVRRRGAPVPGHRVDLGDDAQTGPPADP